MDHHDFRDSIVNVAMILKPLVRIIDDSCHDESPDIVELRDQLYSAYELSNSILKRVYARPGPALHLVD
jgi:hypothetical protein